ncbi:MAG: type II toxin-antitoxin system prevent-host-death family antitoxin [Verrucomicrobiales bacterium]|nr:type II toxin-antitoxin system prevent-host-death family antitoxin [Verrucomicrobiales bacterium]
MKKAKSGLTYRINETATAPSVLKEVAAVAGIGNVINVRAAKAHLSALLDLVAGGQEIVITSDGQPKVKLVSYHMKKQRKVFSGAKEHLKKIPLRPGPPAEEIIRADRDGRGW